MGSGTDLQTSWHSTSRAHSSQQAATSLVTDHMPLHSDRGAGSPTGSCTHLSTEWGHPPVHSHPARLWLAAALGLFLNSGPATPSHAGQQAGTKQSCSSGCATASAALVHASDLGHRPVTTMPALAGAPPNHHHGSHAAALATQWFGNAYTIRDMNHLPVRARRHWMLAIHLPWLRLRRWPNQPFTCAVAHHHQREVLDRADLHAADPHKFDAPKQPITFHHPLHADSI